MKSLHVYLLKQIIRNPINSWYIFIYVCLVLGSKCVCIYIYIKTVVIFKQNSISR